MQLHAYVKGNYFRPASAKEVFNELQDGDTLILEPEPTNQYDPNAIKVIEPESGEFIGYIQKELSPSVAELLAEGPVTCTVYSLMGGCLVEVTPDGDDAA